MSVAPFLTAPRLQTVASVRHAFFTRKGGASSGLYESLNLGVGSKDDQGAVTENRKRVAETMGVEPDRLLNCYQTHSTIVRVAEGAWSGARPEGDAIVTTTPGLALGVLTADCAPVLLVDPQARVAGCAHAGWKGALDGVIGSAVSAMQVLGAEPARIRAAVGPCIGPKSYEVGLEFLERFAHHDPGSERYFAKASTPEKRLFDLPRFVLWRLEQAGVAGAEWIGADTCAEEAQFFSNRRAFQRNEADYGRLISAIVLL
jgi:YfiH family protein